MHFQKKSRRSNSSPNNEFTEGGLKPNKFTPILCHKKKYDEVL